jgi:hypothetical protein
MKGLEPLLEQALKGEGLQSQPGEQVFADVRDSPRGIEQTPRTTKGIEHRPVAGRRELTGRFHRSVSHLTQTVRSARGDDRAADQAREGAFGERCRSHRRESRRGDGPEARRDVPRPQAAQDERPGGHSRMVDHLKSRESES